MGKTLESFFWHVRLTSMKQEKSRLKHTCHLSQGMRLRQQSARGSPSHTLHQGAAKRAPLIIMGRRYSKAFNLEEDILRHSIQNRIFKSFYLDVQEKLVFVSFLQIVNILNYFVFQLFCFFFKTDGIFIVPFCSEKENKSIL